MSLLKQWFLPVDFWQRISTRLSTFRYVTFAIRQLANYLRTITNFKLSNYSGESQNRWHWSKIPRHTSNQKLLMFKLIVEINDESDRREEIWRQREFIFIQNPNMSFSDETHSAPFSSGTQVSPSPQNSSFGSLQTWTHLSDAYCLSPTKLYPAGHRHLPSLTARLQIK